MGRTPLNGKKERCSQRLLTDLFAREHERFAAQRARIARFFHVAGNVLFLVFASVTPASFASDKPDHAAATESRPHRQDRILVRPRVAKDLDTLSRFHAAKGSRVGREFKELDGLQVVHLPPGRKVADMIREYEDSGLVEFAEPDYQFQAALVPNDPQFSALWGLNNTGVSGLAHADISAPVGWDTLNSAANVLVAVIDSGVRYTHEDLAANLWINPRDGSHGLNALDGSNNPWDDNGHGTLVAGVIGAAGNNGKGVAGVAWRVQIMACKFLDSTGNGFVSDAIECIEFARTNGAHVINASWGGNAYSAALADAIAGAGRAGIIFVAAAGNNGANNDTTPFYPASYSLDNVVSVAATTPSDTLAGFSNYGAKSVHLAAPGSSIYSTYHSGDSAYNYASGTSLAAPFVSGTFALMRAQYPTETYQKLISRVLGAVDAPSGLATKCVTGGRLNLANALNPPVLAGFTMTTTTGSTPLTISFADASQGAVASRVWDFGDGVKLTNAVSPGHVFTNDGTFTVTLTVTSDKGVRNCASQTVRAVGNYAIQSANFQWVDTGLMFPLTLNSNGVSPFINLPFPFCFYGKSYLQISVTANGVIGFGTQAPSVSSPTNSSTAILCPFWTDLNVASGARVWYCVRGKAPLRRAVIAWSPVAVSTPAGMGSISFQAVLFESSQRILFQYLLTLDGSVDALAVRNATVGVMNAGGVAAVEYSNNGSTVLTNQQAILFVPTSKVGVTNYPAAKIKTLPPNPAGQFQFQLAGQPAGTYQIEATSDLRQWAAISAGTADLDGVINFIDPQSVNFPQRFYRTKFQP